MAAILSLEYILIYRKNLQRNRKIKHSKLNSREASLLENLEDTDKNSIVVLTEPTPDVINIEMGNSDGASCITSILLPIQPILNCPNKSTMIRWWKTVLL